MVDFNKLSDDVYTAGQITKDDQQAIKDFGFQTIIINRPDNEANGQGAAQETIDWANANGIEAMYLPMNPGQLTPALIERFAQALTTKPKPILAHCASGTRSTILWAFANVQDLGVEHVIQSAKDAGYDINTMRGVLTQFSQ